MITNNRNDSLKAIVSSFNLLPNLARDFKTIRRSLSKITGIKPSITEDSKTKDGKGISPTLVGADDKKKSEGGGLLTPLLLLKLASFGQKKKFLRSPVGKAFRKFRKVSKSIKSIQKTLLNVVKKVFSPKNIIKILSKLALPLVIVGSLFEGLTAGFDAYKETGSIWEAYKATVGGVVEFLTFGLIDKEMVGKFYQGIADFIKPVTDAIGKIYASIKEYVGEKVDGVKTFFGMKVEPKVTKPVIEQPSKEELEKQAKAQEEIEKAKEEERKKQYEGEDEIVRKRLKLQEKSAKKLQEEEDKRRAKEGKPTPAPAPAPAPAAAAPAAAPAAPSPAPTPAAPPAAAAAAPQAAPAAAQATGPAPSLSSVVQVQSGVDTGGLNPELTKRIAMMASAFKEQTGKTLIVTSGFRSNEKQKQLYDDWKAGRLKAPAVAEPAPPLGKGKGSLHSSGLALDIAAGGPNKAPPDRDLNVLAGTRSSPTGWLEKFGLVRNVPGEDWHVQLAGTPPTADNPQNPGQPVAVPTKTGGAVEVDSGKKESISPVKGPPSTGTQVAAASSDVAAGQRQQAKPSTPVIINASTTNNTKINKNEMAAASKPRDTAGMLAARAT